MLQMECAAALWLRGEFAVEGRAFSNGWDRNPLNLSLRGAERRGNLLLHALRLLPPLKAGSQ